MSFIEVHVKDNHKIEGVMFLNIDRIESIVTDTDGVTNVGFSEGSVRIHESYAEVRAAIRYALMTNTLPNTPDPLGQREIESNQKEEVKSHGN